MNLAREMIRAGEKPGFVVSADFQHGGRGRIYGRKWEGKKGENLLFTLTFPREELLHIISPLPVITALGIAEFLQECFSVEALIKWPNDILVKGKKICGILCESYGGTVAVGIGLNVRQRTFDFESSGKGEGGFPGLEATSLLLETGKDVQPRAMLEPLIESINRAFKETDWLEKCGDRLFLRGEEVSMRIGDPETGPLATGRIAGIGESGELLFDTGDEEALHLFSAELFSVSAVPPEVGGL
jgi:BirA family biotin operon repressor/biotin-[acetyl-CoA-carboxylase] ligase